MSAAPSVVAVRVSLLAAASVHGQSAMVPPGACATEEELVVGGITLADSRATVRRKLGNPLRRSAGSSEDDGGTYGTVTYAYKHLEVVFGRRSIEKISTSSRFVKAARGVTVGMTQAQVAERLGFLPTDESGPHQVRLDACRLPGPAQLNLLFAPPNPASRSTPVLVEIAVTHYGP